MVAVALLTAAVPYFDDFRIHIILGNVETRHCEPLVPPGKISRCAPVRGSADDSRMQGRVSIARLALMEWPISES